MYRSEFIRFYDNIPENRNLIVLFKPILDAENTVVESQIKVHQRTQRGCGQKKITINLYHTTNRVMVNGKDIETFRIDHTKIIESIMRLNIVESLDHMLQTAVRTQLDTMTHNPKSTVCAARRKSTVKAIQSPVVSSLGRKQPAEDKKNGDDSIADALWYCPLCKEKVDDGVACDLCES